MLISWASQQSAFRALTPAVAAMAAYIARMTVPPSAGDQVLILNLITSLMATGIWPRISVLYLFASATAQAGRLNMVSANYTATANNSPTFTAYRGYTGNGTTTYISTNYNPAVDGLPINDTLVGLWCRVSPGTNTTIPIGANAGTAFLQLSPNYPGIGMLARVNDTGATLNGTTITGLGLTVAQRTSATVRAVFRNGVDATTAGGTLASTSTPNLPLFVLAQNTAGSPANFDNREFAAIVIGKSLTSGQQVALYNALQIYMTAVGA